MSEGLLWRECPHCHKKTFCVESVQRQHEEDCSERPSLRSRMKICPRCSSAMTRLSFQWICVNTQCDFTLGVIDGGKVK